MRVCVKCRLEDDHPCYTRLMYVIWACSFLCCREKKLLLRTRAKKKEYQIFATSQDFMVAWNVWYQATKIFKHWGGNEFKKPSLYLNRWKFMEKGMLLHHHLKSTFRKAAEKHFWNRRLICFGCWTFFFWRHCTLLVSPPLYCSSNVRKGIQYPRMEEITFTLEWRLSFGIYEQNVCQPKELPSVQVKKNDPSISVSEYIRQYFR